MVDRWHKFLGIEKFGRELIILPDGGTVGISWALDDMSNEDGSPRPDDKRPILLVLPGLGGGSDNIYTIAFKRHAIKQGYKCGTVLFRCCDGLPVTSGKLSYSACW
jgi:predicted alpha/beta-fold hydrolase